MRRVALSCSAQDNSTSSVFSISSERLLALGQNEYFRRTHVATMPSAPHSKYPDNRKRVVQAHCNFAARRHSARRNRVLNDLPVLFHITLTQVWFTAKHTHNATPGIRDFFQTRLHGLPCELTCGTRRSVSCSHCRQTEYRVTAIHGQI